MPKRWLCIFVLLLFCATASALQRQPDADYKTRREALGKKVGGIAVLFGSLEPVESLYSFRQDDDFYYLSGWTEPGAALLIAPAVEAGDKNPARPYIEILFLPPRNLRMERFTGPKLGADDPQAAKLTGFDRVEEISKLPQELSKLMDGGQPIVYTELPEPGETSPISQPLEFLKRTAAFLTFQDVKPSIAALRLHKDAGEISLLQKAVDISVLAHTAAMKTLKPNLPEYQISALLQYEWERRGCERAAYPSIVGSGHNSTVLHYSENTSTMKPGDVVVIDAAAECSMYAADKRALSRSAATSLRASARFMTSCSVHSRPPSTPFSWASRFCMATPKRPLPGSQRTTSEPTARTFTGSPWINISLMESVITSGSTSTTSATTSSRWPQE